MSKYPCIYCDDKLHCTKDTGPNDYKPFCGLGPCPYKTPSNADRIRAMTDEELARYLYDRGNGCEYCFGICAYQYECNEWHEPEFCIPRIIQWLKQEADT